MKDIRITTEQQEKFRKILARYAKDRPPPERNLDQFWATEETVLKRVAVLGNIPNIEEKQLLFLGDDDLTSLAFTLLFRARKVTVVDIDTRLLRFLEMVAQSL